MQDVSKLNSRSFESSDSLRSASFRTDLMPSATNNLKLEPPHDTLENSDFLSIQMTASSWHENVSPSIRSASTTNSNEDYDKENISKERTLESLGISIKSPKVFFA